MYVENVHIEYCIQVAILLHHSSLLSVVLLILSAFLSSIAAIQLPAKGKEGGIKR